MSFAGPRPPGDNKKLLQDSTGGSQLLPVIMVLITKKTIQKLSTPFLIHHRNTPAPATQIITDQCLV
jgi:hypothetical protein